MSVIYWTAHIGTYTIHMCTSLIVMMASSAGAVSLFEGCVAGQLGSERMDAQAILSSDYSV